MKQLIQMFLFDLKMSGKNMMGGYMLIVPVVVLFILRTFLPSVESTTSTFAVVTEGPYAVPPEIVEVFEDFAKVKQYASIADMEKKLRGTGTVEGLYRDPETDRYVSVLERSVEQNTFFSAGAPIIRQYFLRRNHPEAAGAVVFVHEVPAELSDRTKTSPVATMGGSIFIIFMVIASSFLIGLGVVNDKEYGTNKALQVTPVNKFDYYVGKSILPFLVLMLYTLISLFVLGLAHVNILLVYIVALLSFLFTLLLGLLIGALAGNETEAIGIGKSLAMIMMLSVLGGTLLPDSWQWTVYWSPFYWIFNVLETVFTETVVVSDFVWKSAVIAGSSAVYFLLLRKKIIKGLS